MLGYHNPSCEHLSLFIFFQPPLLPNNNFLEKSTKIEVGNANKYSRTVKIYDLWKKADTTLDTTVFPNTIILPMIQREKCAMRLNLDKFHKSE